MPGQGFGPFGRFDIEDLHGDGRFFRHIALEELEGHGAAAADRHGVLAGAKFGLPDGPGIFHFVVRLRDVGAAGGQRHLLDFCSSPTAMPPQGSRGGWCRFGGLGGFLGLFRLLGFRRFPGLIGGLGLGRRLFCRSLPGLFSLPGFVRGLGFRSGLGFRRLLGLSGGLFFRRLPGRHCRLVGFGSLRGRGRLALQERPEPRVLQELRPSSPALCSELPRSGQNWRVPHTVRPRGQRSFSRPQAQDGQTPTPSDALFHSSHLLPLHLSQWF